MSNLDRPAGLKPIKNFGSSSWNGKTNPYYLKADYDTAVFKGDIVKLAGSADATGKFPSIEKSAAGDITNVGVVIGFGTHPSLMMDPDSPNMKYRLAKAEMYALVVDDPFVIFEVQEDGAIDADAVGQAANFIDAGGDTDTGLSGIELQSSNTGATGNLRIMRAVNREDNALGTNCKWEVLLVEHVYREQVTVVDV